MKEKNNFENFISLKSTFKPGKEIEEKIFSQIKAQNIMRRKYMSLNPITAIAVAIIFLLIGFSIGKWGNKFMSETSTKSKYMLLVYELNDPKANSPSRVEEYTKWIRQLGKTNSFASGEKLEESGKIIRGNNVSDISNIPVENRVSGYFMIEADNYKEAVSLAETCPHIKYGGKLEVREVYNPNNKK